MIALNDYFILKPDIEDKPSVSGLTVKTNRMSNMATVMEGSSKTHIDTDIVGKKVVYLPSYAEFAKINDEEIVFIKGEHLVAIL